MNPGHSKLIDVAVDRVHFVARTIAVTMTAAMRNPTPFKALPTAYDAQSH
jgi:hypothetical protein